MAEWNPQGPYPNFQTPNSKIPPNNQEYALILQALMDSGVIPPGFEAGTDEEEESQLLMAPEGATDEHLDAILKALMEFDGTGQPINSPIP